MRDSNGSDIEEMLDGWNIVVINEVHDGDAEAELNKEKANILKMFVQVLQEVHNSKSERRKIVLRDEQWKLCHEEVNNYPMNWNNIFFLWIYYKVQLKLGQIIPQAKMEYTMN